jgi:hypothetical protein
MNFFLRAPWLERGGFSTERGCGTEEKDVGGLSVAPAHGRAGDEAIDGSAASGGYLDAQIGQKALLFVV